LEILTEADSLAFSRVSDGARRRNKAVA